MSVTKTLMTVGTVGFLAVFGGGVYVMMNLGSIAQQVTERYASQTLGVDVDISSMSVSLQERTAKVVGLTIGNPPGFDKPHAVRVEEIDITLGSISKELITFKDIVVRGTDVNVEVKEQTTNLQTIQKNIKPAPKEPAVEASGAEKLKVIINRLELAGSQVNPSVTLLSAQDLSPVTIDQILLTGIGQRENGILVRDAMAQVSRQLLKKFSDAAANGGFYQGMSSEALQEMGVSQINQIKDQVGQKLKGLFGN
ncbi:MAG: hypothetical protein KDJ35_05415 [Alphaproteobacteria bacterium]|nr:hypothetical protein [Alphaproteobacteria bacterium]